MSFYVVDWVTSQAPTANIYESHILTVMAGRADRDGCGVFQSIKKLAASCHCDPKTVTRHIQAMVDRGLLAPGDPTSPGAQKHRKIRADNRPKLYDILVPLEWYSAQMVADINEEREAAGRAPLTSENRPAIRPAPEKSRRSDKGKERPERRKQQSTATTTPSPAETSTGGLIVPPSETTPDYSHSWERGDSESGRGGTQSPVAGGLRVPQNSKKKPVLETVRGGGNPPPPPNPPADLTAGRVDEVVTDQLAQTRNQQTARAKLQPPASNLQLHGETSVREAVMAQVRGKFPSKIRSRVTRPAQCLVEPSEPDSATTSLAG
ncbi:hypothetical protein AB0J47_42105 [Nocardia sp. NPDC049737]|uniref:hypothetical protein n=1 Tax=Nocardia sp. NPDC049737 TaxID=3154358 RepID=UPI00342DE287